MRMVRRLAAVALLGSFVAACGGGGGDDPAPPPPPVVVPPAAPQEDQFGARFGMAFRASPTADPIVPADGDIVPLSVTTNPVPLG